MGELLLCQEPVTSFPYYIEGVSVNIYSMEELCYYISNNIYLLEKSFMCEELCAWVEKELHNPSLAERLRALLREDGRLSEFVLAILKAGGYCTKNEIADICTVIAQMEEKSDFECSKIRADRLMDKEKYLSSIYEYKRLLDSKEAAEEPREILGNIWHNLGTAYARLFLFEEAISCYETAYRMNQQEESYREMLYAYRCLHDEQGFIRAAREHGMDESAMQALRDELTAAGQCEEIRRFEEPLEELAQLSADGRRQRYVREIRKIISQWKESYRRISRV